jgi:hypothetical protein
MPDGSTRTRSPFCRKWAVKGKPRCELHGGKSSGPKSKEGLAHTLAAMREGRKRYEERMKAEGRKCPWGFKKGWRKAKEKEAAVKEAAAKLAALPPIERKILSALDAIAAMQENLRRNVEANR